jgi:ParB-like chromosome segregation protein Spo0J
LIAGERRWRAAKLLGWTTIRAQVEQVDDKEAAEQVLVENLQRTDLSPIERAQGYKRLADMGLNQDEIGIKMGKDQPTVARTLALLSLPQEVQDFMSRDIISEGHIRYLNRIEDKDQFLKVAKQAADKGWSVKETEKQVNKLLGKAPKEAKEPANRKPIADLAWKGPEIAINRHYKPATETLEQYYAWLMQALPAFAETKPVAAVTADPAATAAPPSDAAVVQALTEPVKEAAQVGA